MKAPARATPTKATPEEPIEAPTRAMRPKPPPAPPAMVAPRPHLQTTKVAVAPPSFAPAAALAPRAAPAPPQRSPLLATTKVAVAPPPATAQASPAPESTAPTAKRTRKGTLIPRPETKTEVSRGTAPPVKNAPAPPMMAPFVRPPHDVSIEQYAVMSAELMQRGADRDAILRANRLDEPAWATVDTHWTKAISVEAERGDRSLLAAFDGAYVATQERLRRPITIADYARIQVGLERGEVGRVLGELDLQLSDLMRLQRVWTRRLAESAGLTGELGRAIDGARRGGG